MHLMWFRHSTKLTQISQPPRFIARGHYLIGFLCIFAHQLIILDLRQSMSHHFILFYRFFVGLSTSPIHPLPSSSPSPSSHAPLRIPKLILLSSPPAGKALQPP